jgi:hemerythrin-like domain-containing protein
VQLHVGDVCLIYIDGELWEDATVEIIEILRQEHRNIEKLLSVMEQELNVFDRGERPDYDVFGAIIEFFKMYPDSCHHPKEDIIYEKFKATAQSDTSSGSALAHWQLLRSVTIWSSQLW